MVRWSQQLGFGVQIDTNWICYQLCIEGKLWNQRWWYDGRRRGSNKASRQAGRRRPKSCQSANQSQTTPAIPHPPPRPHPTPSSKVSVQVMLAKDQAMAF